MIFDDSQFNNKRHDHNKMNMTKRIGIIGDYHNSITQSTIADSIQHSNNLLGFDTAFEWIDTDKLDSDNYTDLLSSYSGIWSAPGSPFNSLIGSINAIKYARENNIPHLGTCAGYQHSIIEFARNVLGYNNADHAEYSNNSDSLFINKMSCSLRGTKDKVIILGNSLMNRLYGNIAIDGDYFCSYGLNEDYKSLFNNGDFIISGIDVEGNIRILELKNHPYFVLTVFVPQVSSNLNNPNPIITEFVRIVNTLN